jgi:hypothetical protein
MKKQEKITGLWGWEKEKGRDEERKFVKEQSFIQPMEPKTSSIGLVQWWVRGHSYQDFTRLFFECSQPAVSIQNLLHPYWVVGPQGVNFTTKMVGLLFSCPTHKHVKDETIKGGKLPIINHLNQSIYLINQ